MKKWLIWLFPIMLTSNSFAENDVKPDVKSLKDFLKSCTKKVLYPPYLTNIFLTQSVTLKFRMGLQVKCTGLCICKCLHCLLPGTIETLWSVCVAFLHTFFINIFIRHPCTPIYYGFVVQSWTEMET